MYRGYEIVAVTYFGRRRYTDLLVFFTQRCRYIGRHELWISTQDRNDLKWADEYRAERRGYFEIVESGADYASGWMARLPSFYELLETRERTIYVRLDDDIVWMANDALQRLLDFRIDCPHFFLVYANTVNNWTCTYLHQRIGCLPPFPVVEYNSAGVIAWRRWETAAAAHESFFRVLEEDGKPDQFHFPDWQLLEFERCSINCMAWFGTDNDVMRQHMGSDEEHCLACIIPRLLERPNCIVGNALVCHFAYHTQRDGLDKYRELATSQGFDGWALEPSPINQSLLSAGNV